MIAEVSHRCLACLPLPANIAVTPRVVGLPGITASVFGWEVEPAAHVLEFTGIEVPDGMSASWQPPALTI
jgi:hypothetical protein